MTNIQVPQLVSVPSWTIMRLLYTAIKNKCKSVRSNMHIVCENSQHINILFKMDVMGLINETVIILHITKKCGHVNTLQKFYTYM